MSFKSFVDKRTKKQGPASLEGDLSLRKNSCLQTVVRISSKVIGYALIVGKSKKEDPGRIAAEKKSHFQQADPNTTMRM